MVRFAASISQAAACRRVGNFVHVAIVTCHGERLWARLVLLVVCRPDVLGIRISDTDVNVT